VIGCNCNGDAFAEVPGAVNALFNSCERKPAEITKMSPISAFRIVFFACSRASGFPVEVIYEYPPLMRKNTLVSDASMMSVLSV